MTKKFDPNNLLHFAKKMTNALDSKLVDTNDYVEKKIELRPDKSIATAKFKPHPFIEGIFLAHPHTIKAVREDLFMVGQGFDDFELLYRCDNCKNVLDVQFWKLCPHCAKPFPKCFDDPRFDPKPWEKKDLTPT